MALVDLDATLNEAVMAVWGDAVVYDPRVSRPGAAPHAATGVFDEAHELVLEQIAASELTAAGHSTTAPVLEVRLGAFAAPPRSGDRVTIGARTFQIWDVKPDGAGCADLLLRQLV